VARACVIFNVDEVIVFDDKGSTTKDADNQIVNGVISTHDSSVAQMARILQYLECPQYMRKQLFPQHKDLQFAGLLNPLDSPHHLRADEEGEFREGIVTGGFPDQWHDLM
jgi:predicted SPOUT superfamily RNA methylase MTH1